ncbi:MAG: methyltransferase domain-containing protein [Candidatus Binatia bacterium]
MARLHRRFLIFLLAAGFIWSCKTAAQIGPVFPLPDRPVAPNVSPRHSDEKVRDADGEAMRVMDHIGIKPGIRVADIGAGEGYYTVRLARRLGSSGTIYAQDIEADYLRRLEARLERQVIRGVKLVPGMPNDPKLMPNSVDVALLAHVYHMIENPYEFFYRLRPALAANARVAIIDVDRPTQDHGTPPALLRCELEAVGYRQVDFISLEPAEGYLAIFLPPPELPPVSLIRPCISQAIGDTHGKGKK